MILDKELQFHDGTAITAAGRYDGETVDLGAAGSPVETPGPYIVIDIDTAIAGGTNVTFTVETHTADDFSAARTVLWSSGVVLTADLVAGLRYQIPIPFGLLRYVAVVATGVGVHTSGAFSANVASQAQLNDL